MKYVSKFIVSASKEVLMIQFLFERDLKTPEIAQGDIAMSLSDAKELRDVLVKAIRQASDESLRP